ncbi:glycosyl hydrolase [Silvibacterium dinghuense]|uniref:Glycosyl hydrolase n=1 Tax=Silvibacterium dinghuense TaxID=1560006 RepID=A0A4V1NV60_9BACT|nr:glycosyl hydrolase [Silvibacterium dinghuense]
MKLAASLALASCLVLPSLRAQEPSPDSPAIDQQADAMLKKLTLHQKLELIGGVEGFYIRAEPDAGFPKLKMSDGPLGVRTWGPDTAYAAGVALAASWDPALAERTGEAFGQDARARGVHFLLGPGVNIYRAPMNGRNFEYYGEDPYLSAHTAVPYIEGVQSQGVIATVKHFAANNQEWDRHNVSSDVDERTLREIYLPAFEAAVRVAHVGAVMNSYNLLNGEHATQNSHLNNDILKKDWGFDGILMSDWDATYSAVGAANGGLDLEMPFGKFMNPENLEAAIKSGQVSEATIDDKVRRIFRTAIRFHFLERDQTDLSIPAYTQNGRSVALDEALESITLVKNEGGLLPLDASTMKTLAVIGPDAWPAVPGAGGSSTVTPFAAVSIFTGLSDALGKHVKVLYARGLPTAEELCNSTNFESAASSHEGGVKVETFVGTSFSGTPTTHFIAHMANFGREEWEPESKEHKSIRYTAEYLPKSSGTYLIMAAANGSDSYKVLLDGKPVIEQPHHEGQSPRWIELQLTAGTPVKIQADYLPAGTNIRFALGVRATDELVTPEAKKIAQMADAAVLAVGFGPQTESEGSDRTYSLPWGQDELIEAVSAANAKTIVSVTSGGGVATHAWLGHVPALLFNWYPGQEGGTALAEILLGKHSPEGHLPMSLETSWEENPVHDHYYAPPVPEGQTPHVKYEEGVFIGYRYYTSMHKEPLYPFGFGLSYTTFSFSDLKVSPESASADNPVTVTFTVTNTGSREGAEVAQLYIGDPSAKVKRPVKELKGYQKVHLKPGESQQVTLTLDRRAFAYWDTASNGWKVDPGKFVVMVGDSSENTPLSQEFAIQ